MTRRSGSHSNSCTPAPTTPPHLPLRAVAPLASSVKMAQGLIALNLAPRPAKNVVLDTQPLEAVHTYVERACGLAVAQVKHLVRSKEGGGGRDKGGGLGWMCCLDAQALEDVHANVE